MNSRSRFGVLAAALLLPPLSACSGPVGQPTQGAAGIAASAAAASGPRTSSMAQRRNNPPAAAATVTTSPSASSADADDEVNARIKDVLGGNPEAYHEVFDRLQKDMADGDKAGVAALVAYPLGVTVNGKPEKIHDARELVDNWDRIVTPEVRKAVADQQFSRLFVNDQGVMIGDGQVWITGICKDNACKHSDVRIIAIQQGPK